MLFTLTVSSTTVARSGKGATTSEVTEVVANVLSSDEQSLRQIREAVAAQLDLEPSQITSPVARALRKLVDDGSVERPRRGFYRKHEVDPPQVIGRKLEPTPFVPAQAKPIEKISTNVTPQARPEEKTPEAAVVPKVATPIPAESKISEPAFKPEPSNDVAEPKERAVTFDATETLDEVEPVAEVQPLEPVAEEPSVEVREEVVASVQNGRVSSRPPARVHIGLKTKLQARRDRRWTPQGSMGFQGMFMITLWFVVSGIALFMMNNIYGILTAVGLAIVFWLLHIAMKPRGKNPRAKKAQSRATSALSRP